MKCLYGVQNNQGKISKFENLVSNVTKSSPYDVQSQLEGPL